MISELTRLDTGIAAASGAEQPWYGHDPLQPAGRAYGNVFRPSLIHGGGMGQNGRQDTTHALHDKTERIYRIIGRQGMTASAIQSLLQELQGLISQFDGKGNAAFLSPGRHTHNGMVEPLPSAI